VAEALFLLELLSPVEGKGFSHVEFTGVSVVGSSNGSLLLSEGEPLWVRTFSWGNRCLVLRLGKNSKGRFIVFSVSGNGGRSRTVVFHEGANPPEGWFGVTKVLKETLMDGHKKPSPTPRSAPIPPRFAVGRDRSFAYVVRVCLGDSRDSLL